MLHSIPMPRLVWNQVMRLTRWCYQDCWDLITDWLMMHCWPSSFHGTHLIHHHHHLRIPRTAMHHVKQIRSTDSFLFLEINKYFYAIIDIHKFTTTKTTTKSREIMIFPCVLSAYILTLSLSLPLCTHMLSKVRYHHITDHDILYTQSETARISVKLNT